MREHKCKRPSGLSLWVAFAVDGDIWRCLKCGKPWQFTVRNWATYVWEGC